MNYLSEYKNINQNKMLMTIMTEHHVPNSEKRNYIQIDGTDVTMQAKVYPKEITPTNSSIQLDIILKSPKLLGNRKLAESFGEFGENLEEATKKSFASFCLASLHPILSVFVSRDLEAKQILWEHWGNGRHTWEICSGPLTPKMSPAVELEKIINGESYRSFLDALRDAYLEEVSFDIHWLRIYRGCRQGNVRSREVLLDGEHWKSGEGILDRWDWLPGPDFYSIRQFMIALPIKPKKRTWQFWR
jgi:Family of unknown function (DUF6348)